MEIPTSWFQRKCVGRTVRTIVRQRLRTPDVTRTRSAQGASKDRPRSAQGALKDRVKKNIGGIHGVVTPCVDGGKNHILPIEGGWFSEGRLIIRLCCWTDVHSLRMYPSRSACLIGACCDDVFGPLPLVLDFGLCAFHVISCTAGCCVLLSC